MGVEPTADIYAMPATDFEDRGAHRDTSTPVMYFAQRIPARQALVK